MSRAAVLRPATRLSAFYAATFLVTGIQLPFWPVWLATRGLTAREIGLVLAAAIWAKLLATPAIGAIADRSGARRGIMAVLAATALVSYAVLWSIAEFWVLASLNLVALTAQSALMPLGDTVTLAGSHSHGLDYGRIRVWGSVSFILASLASGAVLTPSSGNEVLLLVLGASAIVFLACLAVPQLRQATDAPNRVARIRTIARDTRFWVFVAAASALQASHQVYYGFGTLYWRSLDFSEATIGLLWAEGVLAEILLFWRGQHFLARFGPVGLMALGGAAGIIRWGLAGVISWLPFVAALQLLHAFTFGASHLGAMHYLSRIVPISAAASAQTTYAAVSSGLGNGLIMLIAGAIYGGYGGRAYLFMAVLSAAGLFGLVKLRDQRPANSEPTGGYRRS
ncbi:MAG: MFS transporter [Alphaproteobacteria bacterium]|nr:MFS transporter [Alphaproteobacteria bacterium]